MRRTKNNQNQTKHNAARIFLIHGVTLDRASNNLEIRPKTARNSSVSEMRLITRSGNCTG
jgi:hypothetical protein